MNFALSPPGGTQKGFMRGGTAPKSNPYPFIYHFFRKGTPFVYLLLEKGTPFIYLLNSRPFLIPERRFSYPFIYLNLLRSRAVQFYLIIQFLHGHVRFILAEIRVHVLCNLRMHKRIFSALSRQTNKNNQPGHEKNKNS